MGSLGWNTIKGGNRLGGPPLLNSICVITSLSPSSIILIITIYITGIGFNYIPENYHVFLYSSIGFKNRLLKKGLDLIVEIFLLKSSLSVSDYEQYTWPQLKDILIGNLPVTF